MSGVSRLFRLIVKEQREILRDRRTLVTLFVMPLLLYPLLSLVIQQFAISGARPSEKPIYRVGLESEATLQRLAFLLNLGVTDLTKPEDEAHWDPEVRPRAELDRQLRSGAIDTIVLFNESGTHNFEPQSPIAHDLRLISISENQLSQESTSALHERIQRASSRLLAARLRILQVPQRAEPISVEVRAISGGESKKGSPLAAMIPLILILMTITGAVYPAIDLTAGERERGTLEVLIAAPMPRMAVLFAKYVAVLTVALSTAAINLISMTLTIYLTDLGRAVLGDSVFTWTLFVQAFAALLLFAAFFAALLLLIASFARSFKEAQAFLIPLMLLSLTPGVVSLFPWVTLTPATAAAPMLNMVIFARDLLRDQVDPLLTAIVMATNACYAAAALAIAARFFGSESVLYGGPGGLRSLGRRADEPSGSMPDAVVAFGCALAIPAFLLLNGLVNRIVGENYVARMLGSGITVAIVFAGVPFLAARVFHVDVRRAFAMRWPPIWSLVVAILFGLSLWPLQVGFGAGTQSPVVTDPAFRERLERLVGELQRMPLAARLVLIGLVPAICEEWFFRGFLFAPLRRFGIAFAIVGSAALFGFFHVLSPSGLLLDRGFPQFISGLALGLLRASSGSIFPGMFLHLLHNSAIALAISQPAWLDFIIVKEAHGYSIDPKAAWICTGMSLTAVILSFTLWSRRSVGGGSEVPRAG